MISWRSFILVEETGVPRENCQHVTSHRQTLWHNVVLSRPRLRNGYMNCDLMLYWVHLAWGIVIWTVTWSSTDRAGMKWNLKCYVHYNELYCKLPNILCFFSSFQYKWLKAEEPVDSAKLKSSKKRRTKTLNSSFGRKTTIKVQCYKVPFRHFHMINIYW